MTVPPPPQRTIRGFVRRRVIRPMQEFVNTEAASGIVLFAAAVVAMAWANSPLRESYHDLWAHTVSLPGLHLDLHEVVNDALMAIFFFVVGLEIKRELLRGELASWRRAALPVTAAFGGMAAPALIYTAINRGGAGANGWGIPMGTDIAFAMGVLALLGPRVPFSLKVFVLALAIVDDLGSIAVIAIAYTESLSAEALLAAAAVITVIVIAWRAGLRAMPVYALLAAVLWVAVFKSGLHATLTGVALAALTPAGGHGLEDSGAEAPSPLERLEQAFHPWTSFLIVPIFALANAGVTFSRELVEAAAGSPVTFGAGLGLLLGKPAGILLTSWLAVRLRFADLPSGVSFVQLLGAGIVAGVGFTVSLFIAGLAFDHPGVVDEAKIGVLSASLIAGTLGYIYLAVAGRRS